MSSNTTLDNTLSTVIGTSMKEGFYTGLFLTGIFLAGVMFGSALFSKERHTKEIHYVQTPK